MNDIKILDGEPTLTVEGVRDRRHEQLTRSAERVMFRVTALYGLSTSIRMPLSEKESIDSGPISLTMDPDAGPSCNLGIIDYGQRKLTVRYGAQIIFPGLFTLVKSGQYDPGLLSPVRVTATDDCTVTPELSGWRALGCLQFLPGSIWAGAGGG